MSNVNVKALIWILVALDALCIIAIHFVKQNPDITFYYVLSTVSTVVSIDTMLTTIFIFWLWKWTKLKGWLVYVPNLNGTWVGSILSTWINPNTGEKPDAIPTMLTIRQNLLNTSCVMMTAEMKSHSECCCFKLDKDQQQKFLYYTYMSVPKQTVKERSPYHYGTMKFSIMEGQKLKLEGDYWTDRKTTGSIEVYYMQKELLECLPEDMLKHPVSDSFNS